MLNSEKLKHFSIKSETRQGYPRSPPLFNITLEMLFTAIRQEKRIKRHANWKRKSKIVIICIQHDSVYKKPLKTHQKLLE